MGTVLIIKFCLPSTFMFLLWVTYATREEKCRPATLNELNSFPPAKNLTDDISRIKLRDFYIYKYKETLKTKNIQHFLPFLH